MATRWEKLRHQVGGIAGFVYLHNKIKDAGQQQGSALNTLDPLQSRLNNKLKESVETLFEERVKPHSYYQSLKTYTFSRLFPTTRAVIETTDYAEKKAYQIEHMINWLMKQHRLIRYAQLGTICVLGEFLLTRLTLHPVKIFMISGIFFSIISNVSAISTVVKDFQKCAHLGKSLLRQPLEACITIKQLGNNLVKTAYPQTEAIESPHSYHLASVVRIGCETAFGTKEDFQQKVDDIIENQACRPIRKLEKDQRFQLLSRITDTTVKKVCVLASTQAFRIILTNLTGLGLAAAFYWVTHYHLDTSSDYCEWTTPLAYAWNRIFPLNWLHQYPEQCHRYLYLSYFSDITKWALRFYIWNRMIKSWEASRETAVEDLMRPVKDWSQSKWNQVTKTFSQTTEGVSSVFKSFVAKFSGIKSDVTPKSDNIVRHIPVGYTVNVEELRSMPLT